MLKSVQMIWEIASASRPSNLHYTLQFYTLSPLSRRVGLAMTGKFPVIGYLPGSRGPCLTALVHESYDGQSSGNDLRPRVSFSDRELERTNGQPHQGPIFINPIASLSIRRDCFYFRSDVELERSCRLKNSDIYRAGFHAA